MALVHNQPDLAMQYTAESAAEGRDDNPIDPALFAALVVPPGRLKSDFKIMEADLLALRTKVSIPINLGLLGSAKRFAKHACSLPDNKDPMPTKVPSVFCMFKVRSLLLFFVFKKLMFCSAGLAFKLTVFLRFLSSSC